MKMACGKVGGGGICVTVVAHGGGSCHGFLARIVCLCSRVHSPERQTDRQTETERQRETEETETGPDVQINKE